MTHLIVGGVTLAAARVPDCRGNDSRLPLKRQLDAPETSAWHVHMALRACMT